MASRIDHTGHPHPSTPKARALCRANGGTGFAVKTGGKAPGNKSPKASAPAGKPEIRDITTGKVISREAAAAIMRGTQPAPKKTIAPTKNMTQSKTAVAKPVVPTAANAERLRELAAERKRVTAALVRAQQDARAGVVSRKDVGGDKVTGATVKAAQKSGIGRKLDQTDADRDRAAARKKEQQDRLDRIKARNAGRQIPTNDALAKSVKSGDKTTPHEIVPEDFQSGTEVRDEVGVWLECSRVERTSNGGYEVLDAKGSVFIIVPPGGKMTVRGKAPERILGGAIADTTRVEFNDGSVGVRKHVRGLSASTLAEMEANDPGITKTFHGPKAQHDAEELGSMLARMMGLKAPEVVREDEKTSIQQFMPGQVAASISYQRLVDGKQIGVHTALSRVKKWTDSDVGLKVGLLDQIIRNTDRNDGNWLADGDDVVVIDHGLAWTPTSGRFGDRENGIFRGRDGFSRRFTDPKGKPKNVDIAPEDLDAVADILTTLRPEFEKRGHRDWWTFSMGQVEAIRPYAKGKKRRIQ